MKKRYHLFQTAHIIFVNSILLSKNNLRTCVLTVIIMLTTGINFTYGSSGFMPEVEGNIFDPEKAINKTSLHPKYPVNMAQGSSGGPEITIWYGDEQSFGQYGNPQPWVNIPGNVSDPDGVSSLSYTLNGGSSVSLSIGPDSRRLQSSGDFNIDLAANDLTDGANEVIITATDIFNNQTQYTVTVNYSEGNVWPIPYEVDWQTASGINDVSQVVDGHWEITGDGLKTVTIGYDRLVAIGDMAWEDYEITVPITIHSYNSNAGIGVLFRWNGHTDYPVSCTQPKCGYLPLGAICWFRGSNKLEIYGNDGHILGTQSRTLTPDIPYFFKARVETNPGVGGLYRFKVWKQGDPEPDGWDLSAQEKMTDPQNGSLLLISHYGDATFGNPTITTIPISITNVQAIVHGGNTSATISWNTNFPATSQVEYGLTTGYEAGTVTDPTLKTSHNLELTNLLPNEEYHYKITSATEGTDVAFTGDLTFTTLSSDIVSDDFHLSSLNTSVWTYVDPLENCSYELVGSNTENAWLNFNLPAGSEHQVWTNGIKVPHVLQNCNNANFEVEAKFESPLNLQYQEQGILVKQDENIYIRCEFYSDASVTHFYVAHFVSGTLNLHANLEIGSTGIAPLYMRVSRQDSQWTVKYSEDGSVWSDPVVFPFAMTVTGIGPYAGNAIGSNSPAHTGSIDYFFNTASPIDPEDPIGEEVIITSVPVTNAVVGQLYVYDVEASGVPLPTFSLLDYPAGMTIDPTSGVIEWTPVTTGDFSVSVEASNAKSTSDVQDYVIHVFDPSECIVSDDFSSPALNEDVWTFIDPLGGGGYSMTGTCTEDAWINISVPGGSPHELWTNGIEAPHILQSCTDNDFELEVRFESSMSSTYQEQGILIKEDDYHFLRFEFYSKGSDIYLIAAILSPINPSSFPLDDNIVINDIIGPAGTAPLYLRVNRQGNDWTISYSFDGNTWYDKPVIHHSIMVSAVGTYAGNAGSDSPAHTSYVDYFNNTACPVSSEDPACSEWLGTIDHDWNTNSNWSLGTPAESLSALIPDVSSSKNFFPVISGSASCLNLILSTGATLDIDINGMLTINRTFLNNGTVTIHSDATGTGSLIDNGFITGTGTSIAERYLDDGGWQYVCAPVNDPSAGIFLGMYMMQWDEPSGEWTYITDPNYVMSEDMEGYALWTNDPATAAFSGELNSGPKSMNATNTFGATHNNKGFNFSGNPYPSGLDWNVDDGLGWIRSSGNIDPSIYIWNHSSGNYGVYVKDQATGTNGVDNIIPAHQGFFIHCSAETGTIGVDNRARIHSSKNIYKKGNGDLVPTIILGVIGNNFTDETIIRIDDQAGISFDNQHDALKFRGSEDAPQLYSVLPDKQELSVNSFPQNETYEVIPLGLEVGADDMYTISVIEITGFESADEIFLEDRETGIFTKIETKSSYDFSSSPGDDPIRFVLHLNLKETDPQIGDEGIYCYSYGKDVYVLTPDQTSGNLIIYNIIGQEVLNREIHGEKTVITLKRSGSYIVKVICNERIISKNVIVK